jgi:hypothetical protein
MPKKTVFLDPSPYESLSGLVILAPIVHKGNLIGIPLEAAERAQTSLAEAAATVIRTSWAAIEKAHGQQRARALSVAHDTLCLLLHDLGEAIRAPQDAFDKALIPAAPAGYATILSVLFALEQPLPEDLGASLGKRVADRWLSEPLNGGLRILVEAPAGLIVRAPKRNGKAVRTHVYAYPEGWLKATVKDLLRVR